MHLWRVDQPDSPGMGELFCGGAFESVLFVCQRLGRKEDSAAPDACPEAPGLRLAAVEEAMALRRTRLVQSPPSPEAGAGPPSQPSMIGPINLGAKQAGKPRAGNPHAGFDVAGTGNRPTVWLVRHSQRKRGATDRLSLRGKRARPRPY